MVNIFRKSVLITVCLSSVSLMRAGEITWPDDYPIRLDSISVAEDYDQVFTAQPEGWLGSDAAHSIVLSKDRVLWLFGDTFLGSTKNGRRYPEGYHINNCIAIEDLSISNPGKIKYFWGDRHGNRGAFFPPQNDMPGKYYWPTSGLLVNNRLLIFCFAMAANEETWWIDGTVVIAVDNYFDDPYSWNCQYYDLGIGGNTVGIHSAMVLEGEYIYFLGYFDQLDQRQAILARTAAEKFSITPSSKQMEYWSEGSQGNHWSSDLKQPVALFKPGVTETDLQYISEWDLYLATTYDPIKADIFITVANKLTGPWGKPVLLFTNPDHVTMTYAARPHPQLAGVAGEVVISYVTSPTSLDMTKEPLDTYRPRFLKLILERTKPRQ